jgi:predicted Fe-Mo cluster-binding NifX family protein
MITIAIPATDGRLHEHFGGCTQFALVQADTAQRKIIGIRTLAAPPHAPGLFPRWLRERDANVVIAGGIGRRALDLFAQQGIAVRAGQSGATVEELADAYLNGQLTSEPEGCTHHQDDAGSHPHHHEHGHGDEPTQRETSP